MSPGVSGHEHRSPLGKTVRFAIIWATPLVTIPCAAFAWYDHGPPSLGTALFLAALCIGSPLLNLAIWRVR